MSGKFNKRKIILLAIALVCIAFLGSGGYFVWNLYGENIILKKEMESLDSAFRFLKYNLFRTEEKNRSLEDVNRGLSQNLGDEKNKNIALENQVQNISGMVNDISGTVGVLQKLSQTDEELLQKYSKIYFLSENYIPSRLTYLHEDYLFDSSVPKQVHAGVELFLTDMIDSAKNAGFDLKIVSAYRSFEEQMSVKTGYKVVYGSGANKFSADQGYSEHQLGTTVDLTTPKLKTLSVQFEKDPAYAWLLDNAYRFGFVLSYPKGNVYYQYEPWHWRFVGIELARRLKNEGKYFYDLTQREIDQYLVYVFDR